MDVRINASGARLAFAVVALKGTVKRVRHRYVKGEGIVEEMVDQPAGYLVYFPRGHVLRFKDKAELARYGLDKKPKISNLSGMYDPETPIGKMFMSQEAGDHEGGLADMHQAVIALATARTGPVVMPEQSGRVRRAEAA